MGRMLSCDLRGRVVAAVEGGTPCRRAAERFGVSAARIRRTILWRFFARHGITLKKRPRNATDQDLPDIVERRWAWFDGRLGLDPSAWRSST